MPSVGPQPDYFASLSRRPCCKIVKESLSDKSGKKLFSPGCTNGNSHRYKLTTNSTTAFPYINNVVWIIVAQHSVSLAADGYSHSRPLLQYTSHLFGDGVSHYKDTTVVRWSYLCNGNFCTGDMAFHVEIPPRSLSKMLTDILPSSMPLCITLTFHSISGECMTL